MKSKILISAAVAAGAVYAFAAINSGLNVGDSVAAFHPKHVTGALKGTTGCFPCTFQNRPQVQVWLNNPDAKTVHAFASALDKAMVANTAKEFKGMVVIIADRAMGKMLEDNAAKMQTMFKNVSIAYLDSKHEAVKQYKINTSAEVKNTVFAYKNWKVSDKMVNVVADEKGLAMVGTAVSNLLN